MEGEIYLNIEIFKNVINEISRVVRILEKSQNDMNSNSERLSGVWKGKSAESYFKVNNELKVNLNNYIEGLIMLQGNISSVLEEFIEVDRSISTSIEKE